MGSETGAKWLGLLILYFGLMTFIVSLIASIGGTSITTSVEDTESGTACGGPRLIYEPYSMTPIDTSDTGRNYEIFYGAHIECDRSKGVIGQDVCEEITGCAWEDPGNWFSNLFGSSEPTCNGEMNYMFMNDTYRSYLGWVIDAYEDVDPLTDQFICKHPSVISNETLCNELSCTWKYRSGLTDIDTSDIEEPKLGLLGNMWSVVKDMFTFRFDFGFEDTTGDYILNFIVFWLPLIGVILAIYVMVRS